ncbi:MAG: hypothetical protein K2G57_04285, partial [Campylobacter jejuni]|nr:hypothetical protein [Campylobacter jejuni]
MITLSSFNRYFGNNPLQTLTKIRDESIENGNPELTKEAREKLGNSFINVYKDYVKLSDKVELVEGSIEDKLRKNEFSESEVKSLFKWIDENTKSPYWMEVDGVSCDEAYTKLFHTSKNIDEFKTKYLEFQQKYLVDFRNINSSQKNSEEDKETFKPIQAESKNKETYKDDSTRNELLKKLLENKFNTSKELELLFGVKFSDDDAGEFNKILSLNSAPKSID